ncbi:High-affinity branched-chain amino acid transport ATP-binding protein LivF [Paracoccus haematequi]|uniref:High-affinity branched-chain amino acid transport ATP-binding protein LivF n=1 Tax=Paracoccus haematequi TaxID=2491866 RepID=A0A447IJ79_9RHOB|nr:ABC transporter ATP-binding protein [Paracoccus haematequi]VDS07514.1 High-affinity branched-chain amino acid transport ATP-binding protein LivF [Paracoccus haematequi]
MSALLQVTGLTAHYGDFQALFGVDLTLDQGQTLAIIGANGAGKTTLMRAITGIARVTGGSVLLDGQRLDRMAAPEILHAGVAMVPEGRRLFPSLTVEENLRIGAHARQGSGFWTLPRIHDLFPVLRDRRDHPATALSGGQQQMVAIGRALMANPRVLLCDELSLGLAPVVIREIYAAFPAIRDSGTAIVVVEQDIGQALKVATRVHCMMEGRITLSGAPADLGREAIHDAYFGVRQG